MKATISAGSSTHYTVREAAWILGVSPSKLWRAIRTGALPTVQRRARLVVPAYALARVLADAGRPTRDGGDAR
jgi:hypothetical protein